MDLLTYLMARKKKKIFPHKSDLLAYLLETNRKPVKTGSGTSIEIDASIPNIGLLTLEKESTQYTTTGKNKWSLGNQYNFTSTTSTWYFVNGTIGAYGSNIGEKTTYKFYCETGKTYIFQLTYDGTVNNTRMTWSDETNTGISKLSTSLTTGTVSYKIIGKNDYVIPGVFMPANYTIKITKVMIEEVSSDTTTPSAYEQYTGGIPSPNPDYPQEINVIKNSLTIEITDGENTKTATIDLGDNEVVGIGDYKDIIKVDRKGNVTLTKKTGKVVYDENTAFNDYNVGTHSVVKYNPFDIIDKDTYSDTTKIPLIISNYYTPIKWNDLVNGSTGLALIYAANTLQLRLSTNLESVSDYQSWLSEHNVEIYYPQAEASEPISLGTIDLTLFRGTNTITNSEDAYMTIKYY